MEIENLKFEDIENILYIVNMERAGLYKVSVHPHYKDWILCTQIVHGISDNWNDFVEEYEVEMCKFIEFIKTYNYKLIFDEKDALVIKVKYAS
jgi:hypothetical protein